MSVGAHELPSDCLVYGAGTFGRSLVAALEQTGTTVSALIDFREHDARAGLPVLRPDEAVSDAPVLLGVCNPDADIRRLVDELTAVGYTDVRTPVESAIGLGARGGHLNCYWLTSDMSIYARAEDELSAARALFHEASSVNIFDGVMSYRRTGRAASLPAVRPVARQYLGDGLDFIHGPLRLVDAGAYTGDTIRNLLSAGVEIEAVLALEPDPDNYSALVLSLEQLGDIPSIALPVALSAWTGWLSFEAASTSASHLTSGEGSRVLAVSGDNVLHGWHPTHIKMDIEGAEPEALRGFERTLRKERPALAVSVYHAPEHAWSIPLWLEALDLDYAFHLGCYGQQTFETVLYAIPQK